VAIPTGAPPRLVAYFVMKRLEGTVKAPANLSDLRWY